MEGQPHPYAPRDLKLPGYVPNFLTQSTIVGVYLLTSLLVVSLIWILSGLPPFPLFLFHQAFLFSKTDSGFSLTIMN
jgi:high-affinity Fe2+/Pb2+ permease